MSKIKLTKGELKRQRWGFTLLELIVVIIIIGVLTSLALPRLFSMVENARIAEAIAIIGQIRAGLERCYLLNNGSYSGCSGWDWDVLGMGNPADAAGAHFHYSVFGDSDAYLVCAARNTYDGSFYSADCYKLCLGLGVKMDVIEAPSASYPGGCMADFDWRRDGKIYWGAGPQIKGFLPKTD